jgi:choline dehydrogenase-like flavoprotein
VSEAIFGPGTAGVVEAAPETVECDVAIVGSGMGGATTAWALRESGAKVLVIERGDFAPREWQNWSPRAVFREGRYKNADTWVGGDGRRFVPGYYHFVGGSTKLYGATLPRLREADFGEISYADGVSPAWPISYDDLEPFYGEAERLYLVHGDGADPTEPHRSAAFPYAPIPHEAPIEAFAERLRGQGLRPYHLPQALDRRPGGRCVLCRTCDAYVCMLDAKGDADVCAMRPAIESPDVRLMTRTTVDRVLTEGGTVSGLEASRDGRRLTVRAKRYVLAAGAMSTAALLLSSAGEGVANSSGQVGRNYMAHTCTFVVGVRPGRDPQFAYHKTLGISDWYEPGPGTPYPLGNVQSLGKLTGTTIKAARRWAPTAALDWFTRRSIDLFTQTEDVPLAENRVAVEPDGTKRLHWRPTNLGPHGELVKRTSSALRKGGYPLVFTQRLGIEATSHQSGTARMGADPATSVVDPGCRAHDLENLWILDSSSFVSSGAMNPALTVAANALRVVASGALTA